MLTYERIENTERFPYAFIVKDDDKLVGSVARTKRGTWDAGRPNGEPIARDTWSSRETAAMTLRDNARRNAG